MFEVIPQNLKKSSIEPVQTSGLEAIYEKACMTKLFLKKGWNGKRHYLLQRSLWEGMMRMTDYAVGLGLRRWRRNMNDNTEKCPMWMCRCYTRPLSACEPNFYVCVTWLSCGEFWHLSLLVASIGCEPSVVRKFQFVERKYDNRSEG